MSPSLRYVVEGFFLHHLIKFRALYNRFKPMCYSNFPYIPYKTYKTRRAQRAPRAFKPIKTHSAGLPSTIDRRACDHAAVGV